MLCDEVGRLLPPLVWSSCFANLDHRPLLIDCWNILSTSSCLLNLAPIVFPNRLLPNTDPASVTLAVSDA